jgi:hypothetical protein
MTIDQPPPNLLDRILAMLGKRRSHRLPDLRTALNRYGRHAHLKAKRGKFLKALFGPKQDGL